LLPEVVAYDNFVAQHGATGGWHPDDLNTFVALLRRSRYTAGKLGYPKPHVSSAAAANSMLAAPADGCCVTRTHCAICAC
jgi:hypothetical protein